MTGKIQNAVTTAKKSDQKSIKQLIQAMQPQIAKALPSVMTPERFTRIALTAISTNPKLAECTQSSFLGALMQAAQLGLEPNTPLGHAYLIPYRNKGVMECQFQEGYRGMIDLAHRSKEFTNIGAHEVYEKDEFEFEYGLEPKLVHKPYIGPDRGKVILYYGMYKLVNGGYGFEVMSRSDVEAHAKRFSKAYSSGPWQSDFDAMAKKTVLKKALKYAPLKVEFVRQIVQDETIKDEIDENMSDVMDKTIYEDAVEADYTVAEDGGIASEELDAEAEAMAEAERMAGQA